MSGNCGLFFMRGFVVTIIVLFNIKRYYDKQSVNNFMVMVSIKQDYNIIVVRTFKIRVREKLKLKKEEDMNRLLIY